MKGAKCFRSVLFFFFFGGLRLKNWDHAPSHPWLPLIKLQRGWFCWIMVSCALSTLQKHSLTESHRSVLKSLKVRLISDVFPQYFSLQMSITEFIIFYPNHWSSFSVSKDILSPLGPGLQWMLKPCDSEIVTVRAEKTVSILDVLRHFQLWDLVNN